ncbi:MAG: YfhO family protein [Candidatus Obscuribacterales bacterium]|nr:YfhO family protein [Candidatus Obscuribacterales bacterium]
MNSKLRPLKFDLFSLLLLLAVVVCLFNKTIFCAQSISRIALLPEWDSLFSQFRTGSSSLYDPSIIHIFLPNYFFIAKTFAQGILPLWNPYSGLGCPLIGDIQTTLFSPFHLFFNLNPSLYCYNLSLLAELVCALTASYFLGRQLQLGRFASIFAALAYVFCPFNLWYLEINLGSANTLFPLVFLFFARAASALTPASTVLAGLSAALLIISGHPESSFFGISFASLLLIALVMSNKTKSFQQNFLDSINTLLLAAFSTIAFSAPILIPFIEYLLNSQTYKYISVCSAHVPWQGIVFNLLNPCTGGGSAFLGSIAFLCLPFSWLAAKDNAEKGQIVRALGLLALIAFLLVTQIGPIEQLFCIPPFTAVITRYCFAILLLILALLAAFGLEQLSQAKTTNKQIIVLCLSLAAITAIAIIVPSVLKNNLAWLTAAKFDLTFPETAFNLQAWKRDLWCSVIFFILVCLRQRISKLPTAFLPLAGIALLLVSLLPISKLSLPAQANFEYPKIALLESLKQEQYRCISTGDHLLKAGSNIAYGIRQLQVHNPLFPSRFLPFIRQSGAEIDLFNQKFNSPISPLLDLASVKYILSMTPVFSTADKLPTGMPLKNLPVTFESEKDLQLAQANFWYQGNEAVAKLDLLWQGQTKNELTYSLVLFNDKNQALWFSDQIAIKPGTTQNNLIPVPSRLSQNSQLKLGLQVFNPKELRFIKSQTKTFQTIENSLILNSFATTFDSAQSNRLKLIQETDNHIRLYENPGALPRAYLVPEAEFVETADNSLAAIINPKFNPQQTVIIESSRVKEPGDPRAKFQAVEILPSDPNTVKINISNNNQSGYLVLTDIYYPGWEAFVNGKQRNIFRANYLFRTIQIFPGERSVVFSYRPKSFLLGNIILFCFLTGLFLVLLVKRLVPLTSSEDIS